MSENNVNQDKEIQEPVRNKISLQEAMRQKMASKKQAQSNSKNAANFSQSNQKMKSQQTKKANNQRRRTGV